MPWRASTLTKLRARRRLTQAALADLTGVHRVTIARLEAGTRHPGLGVVEALAKALGVTVADLLK